MVVRKRTALHMRSSCAETRMFDYWRSYGVHILRTSYARKDALLSTKQTGMTLDRQISPIWSDTPRGAECLPCGTLRAGLEEKSNMSTDTGSSHEM